jgi:AcrR family transcriptional regulator
VEGEYKEGAFVFKNEASFSKELSMPKVTQAHLEARRQQILDAAWACFARKGYHQTTMQDICRESELSPGAIYRYFASKEAILLATNDRRQKMDRALVEEARSQAGGPLDILEVIGQTMFSSFDDPMFESMTRVNIEIWPEFLRNKALRKAIRKEMAFWRTVITELLREAKKGGQLKPEVDPEALAVLLICAFDGLRHYNLIDPDNFKPERLIELMQALVSEEVLIEAEKAGKIPATQGPPVGTRLPQRRRGKKKEAADVRVRN